MKRINLVLSVTLKDEDAIFALKQHFAALLVNCHEAGGEKIYHNCIVDELNKQEKEA